METEFLAGLTQVKAKTLSEIGSGSPGYAGYGSDNRVNAFSLSRDGRVSRVRSGYGSGNWVRSG
jgi:hypothetical protein